MTVRAVSPAGVRRGQAYVGFFKSFTLNSHLVKVDDLFAAKKSKNSDRPSETLLPLSNALHLKIHSTFDVFGWLIVLRYDQNGKASANVSNERINPDDAKHPPH